MASEEPPSKKQTLDFSLCVKCQKPGSLVEQHLGLPTYEKFLDSIRQRAEYGNPDFVQLNQRLHGLSPKDLEENHASWHRSCYGEITHKQHTERDKARWQKALAEKDSSVLSSRAAGRPASTSSLSQYTPSPAAARVTRSCIQAFNRNLCFYCQGVKYEPKKKGLHECRTSNIGKSIQEIVDASDNQVWKVHLADIIAEGDFLSRDIKYHKTCHTTHWRHYVQRPRRLSKDADDAELNKVQFISAELEFFAELEECLDDGQILTVNEALALYNRMMHDHGLEGRSLYYKAAVEKIQENLPNAIVTPGTGKKPTIIHSKKAARSALDHAAEDRDVEAEMKQIFQCSKIIRQAILQSRKENQWHFDGSLIGCSQTRVPPELSNLIRWILQGAKAATIEARAEQLHKSCAIISQSVMQEFKTRRQVMYMPLSAESTFHQMVESPYAVGLSLYMYHNFRSQKAISLLNRCGAGVSYDRVTKICNNIASAMSQNIKEYGVYVPPGLLKNKRIRASLDNIDKKVDTPDGKGSFHGTALGVYQPSGKGETIVDPVRFSSHNSASGMGDVPTSVIELDTCTIEGNPKPRTSPHYPTYMMGQYEEECKRAQTNDIAWMLARFCYRSTTSQSGDDSGIHSHYSSVTAQDEDIPEGVSQDVRQPVDLWSAYNSLTQSEDAPSVIDNAFGLPIINAPAHEWVTLVTALNQLTRLNELASGPEKKLIVTMDMDLYKRALKLEHLEPQYKDKWLLCPGAFHTVLCALRCLGRTIEGSGLDEAWQEADLYSSVTTSQIINGNHHNRAMKAHQITLQALFDLQMEAFFEENPALRTSLQESVEKLTESCRAQQDIYEAHRTFLLELEAMELEKLLHEFDERHNDQPMYRWAQMYMRQVMALLQFQRATREGNWFLYLGALEKLCIYFFAYNRLDYAQNIPEYIARMHELKSTDMDTWDEFQRGSFTVNTSNNVSFTRIGVDQAMEHLNKITKGKGGISGITSTPQTLLKFCLTGPELARLSEETEHLVMVSERTPTQQHHCLSKAKIARQEKAITKLKAILAQCHLFSTRADDEEHAATTGKMFKLMSKEILAEEVQKSILSVEQAGKDAFTRYVKERITGDGNLWDRMTKVKLLTWNAAAKEVKMKTGPEVVTLKATSSLFARMLLVARSSREDIDLEQVICTHELSHTNGTLMQGDGSIHPTNDKSSVIHLLEGLVHVDSDETTTQEHSRATLVVDGMAVVQELMAIRNFKNGSDLARAYVKLIDTKAKGYGAVRIVFDNYTKVSSLKEGTRERRRGKVKDIRSYKVEDSTPIRDKAMFLASNATKDSLTLYLAQQLIDKSTVNTVTVTNKSVMANYDCQITTGVSTQEEADTLMILHAVEVAASGATAHIYTQDTDVLLLALRRVPQLGRNSALIMGTGDRRRTVLLQPIYDALGPMKAAALINWHALTGCDTTGHIRGKGKQTCFKAFMASPPDVVSSLQMLGEGDSPSKEVVEGCEAFLCSLYCPRGVKLSRASSLRWHLFKMMKPEQGVDKLPPTQGAWKQHILRAHLQANIWAQDLEEKPVIPDPLTLGWKKEGSRLVPVLSIEPAAPDCVLELVKCGCRGSNQSTPIKCTRWCSCKKRNLSCTELCQCGGEEDACANSSSPLPEDDEDEDED